MQQSHVPEAYGNNENPTEHQEGMNEQMDQHAMVEQLLDSLEHSLNYAELHPDRKAMYTKLIAEGITEPAEIEAAIQKEYEQSRNNTESESALEFTTKEVHPALTEAYKNTFRVLVNGVIAGLGFIGNQSGRSAIAKDVLPKDDDGNTVLEDVEIELSDGTRFPLTASDHIEYSGATTVQLTPEGLKNRPFKTYMKMAESVSTSDTVYAITTKGAVRGKLSDVAMLYQQQLDNSDTFERENQHASLGNNLAGGPVVNQKGELVAFFDTTDQYTATLGRTHSFSLSDTNTRNELQRLNEDTLDASINV